GAVRPWRCASGSEGRTRTLGPRRVPGVDGEQYQVSVETTYDAYGRITSRTGASGATTSIDYVPDTGPTTEVVTTNPLGHTSTTELEPAWGEPLVETGPNGERSEAAYDPLGRLVKAWLPGQDRAKGDPANVEYEYHYRTDAATDRPWPCPVRVATPSPADPKGRMRPRCARRSGPSRPGVLPTPVPVRSWRCVREGSS